jgi:Uma2 family endonuclease
MSRTAPTTAPVGQTEAEITLDCIYRLTVEQYHAIAQAGIIAEDEPVELLEGLLVRKMTKHRPHTLATIRARRELERLASPRCYVDSQEPVTTVDSEPEPDLMLIRGRPEEYPDRQPGPADAILVVEVADASLSRDRGPKKRIYARAGVPIYWIVNLKERQIEVYTEPSGPTSRPTYRRRRNYDEADLVPVVIDDMEIGRIAVRDVLP